MGPVRELVEVPNGPPPMDEADDDDVGDEPYLMS